MKTRASDPFKWVLSLAYVAILILAALCIVVAAMAVVRSQGAGSEKPIKPVPGVGQMSSIADVNSPPPSYVIASGPLSASDEDVEEGYFYVGTGRPVTLIVRPTSVAASMLRAQLGRAVEVQIFILQERN